MYAPKTLLVLTIASSAVPAMAWPIFPWGEPQPIQIATRDASHIARELSIPDLTSSYEPPAVPETPIPDTDAYTPRTVASSAMQRAFRLAPPRRTHSSREAQLLALMDRGADAAKRDAAAVAVREVVAAVSRLAARAEARALVGAALLQARYIDELD